MSVLLLDSLARHLIPNCKLLREPPWILERVNSVEVCCSCHAAHVSTSPTLLHGSRDLSRAGASVLERKSDTFTVLSHTQLHGLSS